ncbi:DNA polymerase III subunit alpha [Breznakiella homolactica]|uniref:DNA polymerase III subunit alpha n=1 Tax=Breznakiella homolactica TaxID=2798577 RepID=A0A7T7XRG5_9SPIR|nr:DNA polymerase III subunit alpha [Breznakiella homolactica]QQO11079.1 DNA polymerase III subunit alpha [Breznakiella homolactica]
MGDFVHLHVHSDYSLLDGAASVKALAEKAASLGMKHLAITDHGNMFGVLKFQEECEKAGVHAIIGSEFYMAPGSRFEKAGSEYRNKYYHLVLLAASGEGYRNLMKLSSYSYTEGFYHKPRIDEELLVKYSGGLICLSACIAGEIPQLILENKIDDAEKRARWFLDLFGEGNFYLELQDHGIAEQKKINPILAEIARRTGIPLVATNDIHYLEREDSVAQDILLCISTNRKRNEEKRMRFEGDQFYFKTAEEMAALFPEYPEAISNSVRIAERCVTEIPKPGPLLPDFDIPEGFSDADEYMRYLTMEGLKVRYSDITGEIRERAEYELDIIIKMGFTGYFLIVADFINWAKSQDIPVGPGRGSGAGSIVAYALRITDIEPLKYNLLFERFLNPERISMPDFDVDFCYERRGEVIDYVTNKYGKNRVGQIITFGTLKARAVIKDVARALDISLDEANMIAKLIPEDPKMTLEKAFAQESRLKELEENPKYAELFAIARKLENKNRHSSLHAAGIVIGKTDLTDYVPLYRDSKTGTVATQFTMDQLEDCGLVKMDFLGLKTLTLIKNTEKLVKKRGGELASFNSDAIPEGDGITYRMLGEGKSTCVFQFESQGMQNILKQAKPNKIEDLIALNALYRPGPMAYIPQFVESKWGRQAIVYPDKTLEAILQETYGVIVYQEQVMQVAQIIAGYSLGQADLLRRAMGKKKAEVMIKEKSRFIEGSKEKGFSEKDADRIFEILVPFAGYGFNKSHAAAYSMVAYHTAFLKANFPAEFMAANLTNEITSTDKLPEYIDEVRKMDIPIDPPDVNRSDRYFTVVDGRIVYGLLGIKGLGDASAEEIVACRKEGPYTDFMDFLERVDIKTVGKKVIELLIKTGAFDQFGVSRATLAGNLERAVEYAQNKKADKKFGQSSLFEDTGEKEYPDFEFEEFPEWERNEQLSIEKELIGFYFSGHPMDEYRAFWERAVSLDLAHLERSSTDRDYTLVGIIKSLRPYQTKKGRWMGFGSLGDYNGDIDLTFFPDTWEKCRDKLAVDRIIAIKGKVDLSRDRPSFLVDALLDMEQLAEKSYREVHIRLDQAAAEREEGLYPLRDHLFENSGPCSVFIHVPVSGGEGVVRTATQITASAESSNLEALTLCAGVAEVWRE